MRNRYFSLDGMSITPEMIRQILTLEQVDQFRELFEGVKGKVQLQQNIEADTRFGRVKGTIQEGVQRWYSIPYTASTAGENRWRAPLDPEPWDGVLDATKQRDQVLQNNGTGAEGVEGPLTLDVFRPDSIRESLPVLVYVHGGNNQVGDSAEISGASFVQRHDAIVVSIDYRLGTLGFNPLPALKHGTEEENSGNFALLDIAKALDWVHDNIAAFGGDPDNITLSGFSGGARDVTAALIAAPLRGKFHKAISFSGGMTTADMKKSQRVFARAFAPLAVEDGKAATLQDAEEWLLQDSGEVRDYLYSLSPERCVTTMGAAWIRMEIFPHMYRDGAVLPKDGFDTDDYYDVPYMLYTGANEFSLFSAYDPYFTAARQDGSFSSDPRIQAEHRFVTDIGSKFYSLLNCMESLEHIATRNKSKSYGIQVDFGKDPSSMPMPYAEFGPYHGLHQALIDLENEASVPMVGTVFEKRGPHNMQLLFQDYVYNFMKTGDPNGAGLPLWEDWSAAPKGSVLHLDADDTRVLTENKESEYNYDAVLEEIAAYDGIDETDKLALIKTILNGRWFSRRLDEVYGNLSEFER